MALRCQDTSTLPPTGDNTIFCARPVIAPVPPPPELPGASSITSSNWTTALPRNPGTTAPDSGVVRRRSEEHTSELQSRLHLVCRLLLEKKKMYERVIVLSRRTGQITSD